MNKARTRPMNKAAQPPLIDKGAEMAIVLFSGYPFNAVDNGLQEVVAHTLRHTPFQNENMGRKAQGFPENGFRTYAGFVRDKGKDCDIKESVGEGQRKRSTGKGCGRVEFAPSHSQHGRRSINAKSPNARRLKNAQLLPGAAADIKDAPPAFFLAKSGNPPPGVY